MPKRRAIHRGFQARVAYRPTVKTVSEAGLDLVRRMDTMHMESPAMGARQFVAQLRLQGVAAGRNRVRWLMLASGTSPRRRKPA